MKESAGILLYQISDDALQVLLVHPSGNYNKRAPWGIPKGLPEASEDMQTAARRETLEETGIDVQEELVSLGHIEYSKSRKRVHCFAAAAPKGCEVKNLSWEIDKAEFLSLHQARKVIHPDQAPFLDRLCEIM